jgi:chemotaxis protein CheZ
VNEPTSALPAAQADAPRDGGSAASGDNNEHATDRILARIGQLTRTLRDSMRELGLDKHVERAAEAVPDARDRLRYVADMTEQAAERVLSAIELAKPRQEALARDANALSGRWGAWYEAPIGRDDARTLLDDTRVFLQQSVPEATTATNEQLLAIMLAQDFQDLTGQVIKKIMDVVYLIEQQLLTVLIENIAPERREQFAATAAALAAAAESPTGSPESLLNGPQVNPEGKSDVMQDQQQVDDLLASLGF